MSAGTGVFHSEYNKNKDRPAKFLQIWVYPDRKNVKPRYDQITLNPDGRRNQLQQVLSPDPYDPGVWIYQQAWFHLGKFDQGITTDYLTKNPGNGIYVFVLKGNLVVDDQLLNERDGFGILNRDRISMTAETQAEFLLMEVPLKI